ncbi:MAG: T9SS type A sorting domain-containing protein [Sphingobacteriales bacterium]|nr:MAG: T9SS type A sorting domain-containing protein [Sphingobacteriales bacterium]
MMKIYKRTGFVAALFLYNIATAQTNYPPAAPALSNIIKAEYFIDNDPGHGNATPVSIMNATNIAGKTLEIPLVGVTKGVHFFFVRTQDANGKWSHTVNRIFMNFSLPPYTTAGTIADIVKAEYFIDVDPGHGNAIPIAINNNKEIPSQVLSADIQGLSQGIHVAYIRTKDASGKWSHTAASIFNYTNIFPYPQAPVPSANISTVEAFIDNDPGFGNAVKLNITPGENISNFSFNLPVTGLNQGVHYLFLRSLEKPWSLTAVKEFVFASVVPLQWLYFNGEVKNESSLLKWGTATEVNTASFNVQHSTDGTHFITVDNVEAGSAGAHNNYHYTHPTPVAGFNFYRIQQVDKDGQTSFSQVIKLLFQTKKAAVALAPNPVNDQTYIIQNSRAFVKGYKVLNAAAQTVRSEKINAYKEAAWQPDFKNLKTGVYTIRIDYEHYSETIRFIKK